MPSFSTPLSGLNADSQNLSVIANNLANLNTVGYKDAVTNFQDLFYQQIGTNGAGNPVQVGVGTQVSAISGNFTQGSIQATGVPTDVAIQGNGFITAVNNGLQLYTRAGNLSVATNGALETADGGLVQGYEAVKGVINPNQVLAGISIPAGLISPPNATTNVAVTLNLDSATPVAPSPASQQTGAGILPTTTLTAGTLAFTDGTNAFTTTVGAGNNTLNEIINVINANPNYTAALSGNSIVINAVSGKAITIGTNTLTDAAAETETFATSGNSTVGTFSTTVAINDALGASHVLTFNFTKTAANAWNYSVTIPTADITAGGVGNTVLKTGTMDFNGNGQLTTPATNVAAIPINTFTDGSSPLTFNWQIYDPNGSGLITQVAGTSAASSTLQNGYPSGTLASYTIDNTGTVQGSFTNGQTVAIAQIALATFANLQGLQRNGSNDFLPSLSSGAANIGAPGAAGRGTITGGSLEESNADIATEFSQLILAERGYEANAKAITTFDQVTQDAINLKQ
jgi:flagellar hook protein FlgE